jgi:hypothetical protein
LAYEQSTPPLVPLAIKLLPHKSSPGTAIGNLQKMMMTNYDVDPFYFHPEDDVSNMSFASGDMMQIILLTLAFLTLMTMVMVMTTLEINSDK